MDGSRACLAGWAVHPRFPSNAISTDVVGFSSILSRPQIPVGGCTLGAFFRIARPLNKVTGTASAPEFWHSQAAAQAGGRSHLCHSSGDICRLLILALYLAIGVLLIEDMELGNGWLI